MGPPLRAASPQEVEAANYDPSTVLLLLGPFAVQPFYCEDAAHECKLPNFELLHGSEPPSSMVLSIWEWRKSDMLWVPVGGRIGGTRDRWCWCRKQVRGRYEAGTR